MKITTENGKWMNINEANPDFVDSREHWVEYARNAGAEVEDDAQVAVFLPYDEEEQAIYAIEDYSDFVFSYEDGDLFVPEDRDAWMAYAAQALAMETFAEGFSLHNILVDAYHDDATPESMVEAIASLQAQSERGPLTRQDWVDDDEEKIHRITRRDCEKFLAEVARGEAK